MASPSLPDLHVTLFVSAALASSAVAGSVTSALVDVVPVPAVLVVYWCLAKRTFVLAYHSDWILSFLEACPLCLL